MKVGDLVVIRTGPDFKGCIGVLYQDPPGWSTVQVLVRCTVVSKNRDEVRSITYDDRVVEP